MKHKDLPAKARSRHVRLVTLATVTAYAAVAGGSHAIAQNPGKTPGGPPQSNSTLPVQHFAIPAEPLKAALKEFETQSGLKTEINLPADPQDATGTYGLLDGFNSPGVNGLYPNDIALRQLLSGTGLSFKFLGLDRAQIGLQHADTVEVTSDLPGYLSMQKFTEPLLDTPQTISVVPQFLLQEEGISTLKDSLRNVPGISLAAGEAGAQGDNLTIRGFTARNDIFLDGIRDFGSYYRDSFNYEQVDVLEGPAGIQFGRGSTGGVINQESKIPQTRPFINVQTQLGTDLTRRIAADINKPFPDFAGGTAIRLNVMGDEAGVAERHYAEVRRYGVAPSISFGQNSKTSGSLSYIHLGENDIPDYGLPWLYNQLAPGVNRSSYFGFHNENFLTTHDDIVTGRASHSFNNADLHTIARWANYPRNAQITEPQICSNASVSVPVGGTVSALPTSSVTGLPCRYTIVSDPSTILVNRNQIQVKSVEGDLWDQTELASHFKALGIPNALVVGVEGGQEISNPIRTSYTIKGLNTVPFTTLVDPNEEQAFAGTAYITSVTHTKSNSVGLYFIDTIQLGHLFELSGGVRWDRFNTSYNLYQPTPPPGGTVTAPIAPISQIVAQPTYRAAFVYKPSKRGSIYFDYGTSFNPSAESLSLSVSSSILPPEENETYEVGSKWNFLNERLMVEGAFFRTEKDNARETDPTNSSNIVLAGNQLVKGAQFSVIGRLPDGLDVVIGYAYLNSDVIYSKFYPTSVGYPLANVPKQTFNAFITHRLAWRLNAGLGGNYVASRTASSTVPFVPLTFSGPNTNPVTHAVTYTVLSTGMKQVPGYWVFNAMIKRPINDHLDFQINANNVLNRFFIDLPHPSHLIPGEGANVLFGVNFKF